MSEVNNFSKQLVAWLSEHNITFAELLAELQTYMPAAPMIYEQLSKVQDDIGAIEKSGENKHFDYKFRGIDQVFNALNPALVKHRVIMVPVLETVEQQLKESTSTYSNGSTKVTETRTTHVIVNYTFFAKDGSSVTARFPGEAQDTADKSTNKAMQAALKYCVFQMFVVPTEEQAESDADHGPTPEGGSKSPNSKKPGTPAKSKTPVEGPEPDSPSGASNATDSNQKTSSGTGQTGAPNTSTRSASAPKGQADYNPDAISNWRDQTEMIKFAVTKDWSKDDAIAWCQKAFGTLKTMTNKQIDAACIHFESVFPDGTEKPKEAG